MKKYSWSFRVAAVLFLTISLRGTAADNFFFDVSPDHAHFPAIAALHEKGILQGFSGNVFHPDQAVTRAEALKILLTGTGRNNFSIPSGAPFPDVAPEDWFAPFVAAAKADGIVQGNPSGNFAPGRTVTQAEALKILLLIQEIPVGDPPESSFSSIDSQQWFAPFYAEARERQLLGAPEVNPSHELSRAELAEIFYRFLQGAQTFSFPVGTASYYGSAESSDFTAAHRLWDFGTHVLVRSLTTAKAVIVEIVDRGPYTAFRNLDLSRNAFSVLAPLSSGLHKVEIDLVPQEMALGPVAENCGLPAERATIAPDAFSEVRLAGAMPRFFRKGEVFTLKGEAPSAAEVTVFWRNDSAEYREIAAVQNGHFEIALPFLETGKFNLAIIAGQSGAAAAVPIEVFAGFCFSTVGEQPAAVQNLQGAIQDGEYVLKWEAPGSNFFRVLVTQNEKKKEFFVNGATEIVLPPAAFADFSREPAAARIFAAKLSSRFSTDLAAPFSESRKIDFIPSQHYFSEIDALKISNPSFPASFERGAEVTYRANFSGELKPDALIIAPDGQIEAIPLDLDGQRFTLRFVPDKVGTYLVEVNAADGIAVVNVPLTQRGLAPILPDYFDLNSRDNVGVAEVNLSRDRVFLLNQINAVREEAGLLRVQFTEELNELAQFRSEDMADRDYFGHTTPDGTTVQDLQFDFGIKAPVFENIAIDVNVASAHEGLMRSALHRDNILSLDRQYLGIGIVKDPRRSGIILTELFTAEPLDNSQLSEYRSRALQVLNSQRTAPLEIDPALQDVAASWARKMTENSFFSAKAPNGETLLQLIRAEGIKASVQTALYQYESLAEFLEALNSGEDSSFLFDAETSKAGIGMYVSEEGILTVALLLM